MLKLFSIDAAALLIVAAVLLTGCGESRSGDGEAHEHAASGEEFERGPHNGRLLRDGELALEVVIAEEGQAPELRAYLFRDGKPLDPSAVQLRAALTRFGGTVQTVAFAAKNDYLSGTGEIHEPHSFAVRIDANYQGRPLHWEYAAYEGRTTIPAAMAQQSGIAIGTATPGAIQERIALHGVVQADTRQVSSVNARFPGVIKRVDVELGTSVKAGQTLALIESNESLQTYALSAPIAGTVIRRHANAGEATGSAPLFEIADYSQLTALLNVFPRDRARIQRGQTVAIRSVDGGSRGDSSIQTIALTAADQPALTARALLANGDGRWLPGQFVSGDVVASSADVAVRVPLAALQTLGEQTVVFLNDGDLYQAQPVETGRRDGDFIEIVGGLRADARIVIANSYLLKADIEKSGAAHDH